MARTTGRTVAVIVGLVVVIAVVALVAYRVGRTGGSTVNPPTPSNSAVATSPTPTYSPTNQQGSPEPALAQGPVTAGQGGRSRGPAGLPLGYTHDESGAVSAATNYLMWMNSIRIKDDATAQALAGAAAVDAGSKARLIASFADLRSGMKTLTADQPEPARGAYAIRNYSNTTARIYIWAPEVTKDAAGDSDQVWSIAAVDVTWTADDWKLGGQLVAETGGAAADPTDPAGNPTAAEKHAILSRTPADPGEITDTAEQTWFEYADAPH